MAISFNSSSLSGVSQTPMVPWFPGSPASPATPSSTLGSTNTSPISTTPLSTLYSNAQSQFKSTPGPAVNYQEDPRLTQMLQLLMSRGNQSDAEINAQADNAYSSQRKAAEGSIAKQQTRALAANGVLPTGGLASQYYNEISQPIFDRLDAQRAQTVLDLNNARDNVRGSVTSTLSGINNNQNQFSLSAAEAQRQSQYQAQQMAATQAYQQAQLQQQAALASQQLAAEQARAQQQASLAQQQLDYTKQSDAQRLAFQREQAALQDQRFYSGGGGGSATGSMGGGSGLSFGFDLGANDTAQMRNNYNNMWNGSTEGRWGQSTYTGDGSAQPRGGNSQYPTVSSSTRPTQYSQISSPATSTDAFRIQTSPTSFYTPPASGSFFSPTGSMFS